MTTKFYRWSIQKRREFLISHVGLLESELDPILGEAGINAEQADRMVENAIGVFGMPFAVCRNLLLNGEERLVPMTIEEPSVVAAASHAAKLVAMGGGFSATVSSADMIGQVQLLNVVDFERAEMAIRGARRELLNLANADHPTLVSLGGGARDIEIRLLPPMDSNDPCGPMLIVHLIVDMCDAMGANAVNSMCERLAFRLEELSGGNARLRILSNFSDRRRVSVKARIPFWAFENKGAGGSALAHGIQEASVFAERDPYRAATHNKGIMNGVDAVLLAFGQDWRAVEAGAHAWAARSGRYTAMATWRVKGEFLEGHLEIPMAVGTVGGIVRVHPIVPLAMRIAGVKSAADLAMLVGSVGLAQNLGALRALASEGIQRGHMRLHARNIAVEAGASGIEVELVAEKIATEGSVRLDSARQALISLRKKAV